MLGGRGNAHVGRDRIYKASIFLILGAAFLNSGDSCSKSVRWTSVEKLHATIDFLSRQLKPKGRHEYSTFVNSDCTIRCDCNNGEINCNTDYRCSPDAQCKEVYGNHGCYCNEGYVGDGETCTAISYTDCYDAYQAGNTKDGVYNILPSGWLGGQFEVFCDMTSDGGGWTVFQRRVDGSIDFYRNWNDYKIGFGTFHGEFWLGNDKLSNLTNSKTYELRIDMVSSKNTPLLQTYPSFAIANESQNYRLTLDRGNARTGMYFNAGRDFSTYDRDNDRCSVHNCAENHRGGWWYGGARGWCTSCFSRHCSNFVNGSCSTACTDSNLNGDYSGGNGQSIIWYRNAADRYCNMKYSEMKIRPSM